MPANAVEREAQAILALPIAEQRVRLSFCLARSHREPLHSRARELALDFNANLCTRVREIAESRRCQHPWTR